MDYVDQVYYTVMGEMEDHSAIPGVENAFTPGSACDRAYEAVYGAYERLRAAGAEGDAEVILDAMLTICREVGRRMYRLGESKISPAI